MTDADKQLAYYLACRGNGTRIQVNQAGTKYCSKRAAKAHGAGIKHARKKQFKWLLMSGGKTPPQRFKYGIP